MKRILPFLIVAPLLLAACNRTPAPATGAEDRAFWVESMVRIVTPVYENLSRGTLRQNMPVETVDGLNTGNKRKSRFTATPTYQGPLASRMDMIKKK